MESNKTEEILRIATRKDLAETGGAHNQKGVDFQRAWALERMFELEKVGAKDFLFLFESIQDVAELDSPSTPSTIRIYQVKKKDRGDWKWNELTHLVKPGKTRGKIRKNSEKGPDKKTPHIKDSPLGKLYASALAFTDLSCCGTFLSNTGCDLPLEGGGNAATSLPCNLSKLETSYLQGLITGLETLHAEGTLPVKPGLLHVQKVAIHPDQAVKHLLGTVVLFLTDRSPRHAGQAQALVEALLATIAPLGAKTDTCQSFEELRNERGYSRSQFTGALSTLEDIPDLLKLLEDWMSEENISFMEKAAIRVSASKIFRLQVMGGEDPIVSPLLADIDTWLESNFHSTGTALSDFIAKAKMDLTPSHPAIRPADFTAHLLLKSLKRCVDQT